MIPVDGLGQRTDFDGVVTDRGPQAPRICPELRW